MQARYASLIMALVLPALAVADQVYEWKDANGKTHYTDRPPAGVDAKPIGLSTGKRTPPSSAPAQATSVAPKAEPESPEEAAARKEYEVQKAEYEKNRAANCEEATRQLKLLESGQRARTIGPNGESIVLDDEARQKAINDAQNAVRSNCQSER